MRIRLVMRLLTGAATLGFLGLLAAACGSDDPVAEPAGSEAAETAGAAEAAEVAEPSPTTGDAGGDAGAGTVDEGITDDGAEADGIAGSAAPEPALAGPGDVPDLQMIDMHTGTTLNLQSVVDGQTPLLFWFWAPH